MGAIARDEFDDEDWLSDGELSLCRPGTRGIWMDAICRMRKAGGTGMVTGTLEELSRLCRCTTNEMRAAIGELELRDIAAVTYSEGLMTLRCLRMNARWRVRRANAERQRRFKKRGGGDPGRWPATRLRILDRDSHRCGYCGRIATTVDHVRPRARGGSHADENLVACCAKCNARKNCRTPEEAGMRLQVSSEVSS